MTPAAIRTNVLVSLRQSAGQPLAESVLVEAIVAVAPSTPRDVVRAQIHDLERAGLLTAVPDAILGQNLWSLTSMGESKANQLR